MTAWAAPALAATETPDILRLATAGSVDDGKSTLIGRLLHDARAIADDQLAAVEHASRRRGRDGIDLALLTDGLRAEREQGITIDVAYRYFTTARRRFVIADTPGHVQYTRNMVTGASTADVAIILIDARAGVVEQTRRHLAIATLLRVPQVVVAVNKMDLVSFDADRFTEIADVIQRVADRLAATGFGTFVSRPADLTVIPTAALHGDNVVDRSAAMPWYEGRPLLEHLETLAIDRSGGLDRLRFPVQWVIRGIAGREPEYRAYAGRIEAGTARNADSVIALPGGRQTRIAGIDAFDGPIGEASSLASVAIRLVDDLDLGRGALLVAPDAVPEAAMVLEAVACSLGDRPLRAGARCLVKHTTREVRAVVQDVGPALDLDTLRSDRRIDAIGENEIAHVRICLAEPVFADPYVISRTTGGAILIDEATNDTVAGLLIEAAGRAA